MKKSFIILISFCINSLNTLGQMNIDLIHNLMKNDSTHFFDYFLQNNSKHRIQIEYTQIDYDTLTNKPIFSDYQYNSNNELYFFPASLSKLLLAVFTLEQLNKHNLPINTKFCYTKDSLLLFKDSLSFANIPSVERIIEKALILSDNPSANILYDIAGFDYIQLRMKELGLNDSRIINRFAKPDTNKSRINNSYTLIHNNTKLTINEHLSKYKIVKLPFDAKVGKAYLETGKLINKPMDFAFDNYLSLADIHDFLRRIMLYSSQNNSLLINDEQLTFLQKTLCSYPKECKAGNFKKENGYNDACRKYIMYGTTLEPDSNLRIYNKVGLAYGFASDVAYIYDFKNNIDFMLSATIYVNDNQILNDGKYEYEKIAFPFFKNLGSIIYQYELKRKRMGKKIAQPPVPNK